MFLSVMLLFSGATMVGVVASDLGEEIRFTSDESMESFEGYVLSGERTDVETTLELESVSDSESLEYVNPNQRDTVVLQMHELDDDLASEINSAGHYNTYV